MTDTLDDIRARDTEWQRKRARRGVRGKMGNMAAEDRRWLLVYLDALVPPGPFVSTHTPAILFGDDDDEEVTAPMGPPEFKCRKCGGGRFVVERAVGLTDQIGRASCRERG